MDVPTKLTQNAESERFCLQSKSIISRQKRKSFLSRIGIWGPSFKKRQEQFQNCRPCKAVGTCKTSTIMKLYLFFVCFCPTVRVSLSRFNPPFQFQVLDLQILEKVGCNYVNQGQLLLEELLVVTRYSRVVSCTSSTIVEYDNCTSNI